MQIRSFLACIGLAVSALASFGQCVDVQPVDPICQGDSIMITAILQPGCQNGSNSYTFDTLPIYSPESFSTGTMVDTSFHVCTSVAYGSHDDCIAGPFNIGFSFCFFNQIYTRFWVGANGWISFSEPPGTAWCTYTSQVIPSQNNGVPRNAIFAPWEDWLPTYPGLRKNVFYYTTGTTPFQKLVVYWKDCRLYACHDDPNVEGTFQIVLNEQGGIIENHIQRKPACSGYNATQGVQNDEGLIAFTATGRNNTQWVASDESTRFVPSGFTWYANSYPGGPIAGYGSKLTVSPAVTTTYYCEVETCNNTPEVDSVTVTVLPHPTITGPASVCEGVPCTYTTETGMINYAWSVTGGTIISGGSGNPSVVVTWNVPTGPHTISVNYDDPVSTCIGITPVVKTITYHAPALPVVTGEAQPCQDHPGYIYSTATGNTFYSWTVTNGTITAGGDTDDETVTVTWESVTPGQVSVNYTDAFGCISASPGILTITPIESPVVTTPATQATCSGQVTDIALTSSIPSPGVVTFSWPAPVCINIGSGCPMSGGTGNTLSFTPVLSGTDAGTVTFTITPTFSGCDGPSSQVVIQVNPVPSVNPVAPQLICSGEQTQPVTLGSDVTSLPVDYTWTVTCDPTGIPVCPAGGTVNPIPAVSVSNTDLVPRYVTYSIAPSVAGCTGAPLTSYYVQVNPSPTITTNPLFQEICSGSQSALVNLEANVGGTTTFAWTVTPSSGEISGFVPGPGTGNIPVQTIHNTSHTTRGYVDFHIIPSSQSGMPCPGAPADYRIWVNPLPDPSITGPQQVCYDQSGTVYSTTPHDGHDYLWTVPGSVSFTGNHTSSISVDWGPGPSGTVHLTEVDQNYSTNCSTIAPSRDIIINPAPAPVITAIPALPDTPCGYSQVTYSLGAPLPNHAYLWSVSGGSPSSGNNSVITVNWGNANPVGVSVTENITYAPGVVCAATAIKSVTLNLIPDAAGMITGPSSACKMETTPYVYSIAPVNNADSYTWWYDPPAGVTITNNMESAGVTFDQVAVSGSLFVRGIKTGCSAGPQSPPFPIVIHTPPVVSLAACFDLVTTRNARPFVLKGGTPLGNGGKYYLDGNLVAGGILDPATLSPTTHTVSFTYTDIFSCAATAARTLTVNPSNAGYICSNNIFTDPRDPDPATNKYPTYAFTANGRTACWMLKNLNWGVTVSPGLPQTDNCSVERYCLPDDDNCLNYGALYQWDELMQYGSTPGWVKGVCPPGWHVPSSAEWQDLTDAVTSITPGAGVAGTNLRDLNSAQSFHALLNGILYQGDTWAFTTGMAATMFWSSDLNNNKPLVRGLNTLNPSVSLYAGSRADAFPVRCVKD